MLGTNGNERRETYKVCERGPVTRYVAAAVMDGASFYKVKQLKLISVGQEKIDIHNQETQTLNAHL